MTSRMLSIGGTTRVRKRVSQHSLLIMWRSLPHPMRDEPKTMHCTRKGAAYKHLLPAPTDGRTVHSAAVHTTRPSFCKL